MGAEKGRKWKERRLLSILCLMKLEDFNQDVTLGSDTRRKCVGKTIGSWCGHRRPLLILGLNVRGEAPYDCKLIRKKYFDAVCKGCQGV